MESNCCRIYESELLERCGGEIAYNIDSGHASRTEKKRRAALPGRWENPV